MHPWLSTRGRAAVDTSCDQVHLSWCCAPYRRRRCAARVLLPATSPGAEPGDGGHPSWPPSLLRPPSVPKGSPGRQRRPSPTSVLMLLIQLLWVAPSCVYMQPHRVLPGVWCLYRTPVLPRRCSLLLSHPVNCSVCVVAAPPPPRLCCGQAPWRGLTSPCWLRWISLVASTARSGRRHGRLLRPQTWRGRTLGWCSG